jgi:hypothetical protein
MGALEDSTEGFPGLQHVKFGRSWTAYIPIGASGATGTITGAPFGFACAKNGTGTYDCTGVPVVPTDNNARVSFGFYSPTPTVSSAVTSAKDFTSAGTFTFKTLSGVTPTEPASGDIIYVFFEGESR